MFNPFDIAPPWSDPLVVKGRKPVYHGTTYPFEKFEIQPHDIGVHFGTLAQAESRIASVHQYLGEGQYAMRPPRGANVRQVYLNIKNPLRLPDTGSWNPDTLLSELQERHLVTFSHATNTSADMRRIVEDAGYDSIVYKNRVEGVHSNPKMAGTKYSESVSIADDSYIVFHPESQIQTVFDRKAQKAGDTLARWKERGIRKEKRITAYAGSHFTFGGYLKAYDWKHREALRTGDRHLYSEYIAENTAKLAHLAPSRRPALEALSHSGIAKFFRRMAGFGSGWRGIVSVPAEFRLFMHGGAAMTTPKLEDLTTLSNLVLPEELGIVFPPKFRQELKDAVEYGKRTGLSPILVSHASLEGKGYKHVSTILRHEQIHRAFYKNPESSFLNKEVRKTGSLVSVIKKGLEDFDKIDHILSFTSSKDRAKIFAMDYEKLYQKSPDAKFLLDSERLAWANQTDRSFLKRMHSSIAAEVASASHLAPGRKTGISGLLEGGLSKLLRRFKGFGSGWQGIDAAPKFSVVSTTVSPETFLSRVGANKESVILGPKDQSTVDFFREQIKSGAEIKPSSIHLDEFGNIIGADGRHRALAHMLEKTERMHVTMRRNVASAIETTKIVMKTGDSAIKTVGIVDKLAKGARKMLTHI